MSQGKEGTFALKGARKKESGEFSLKGEQTHQG